MKTLIKSTLLLSALFATAANVHAASHHKTVFIGQYDLDGDWNISLAEFDHARKRRFSQTDADNNGTIDEDEYVFEYKNRLDNQLKKDRKGQVQQTIVRFDSLDKDDDKKVKWQEYRKSGDWAFNHFDTNKDGQISQLDTKPEYKRKQSDKPLSREELEEKRQQQLRSAQVILRMPTTHSKKGMLGKYDTDGDGIILREEYDQFRRQAFDLADSDNNQWISEKEYLFEFENRLDKQIAKTRKQAIKQTHVRFKILDKNKSTKMTLAEYQTSGYRSFSRLDTNSNDVVNFDDPKPAPRKKKIQNNNTPVSVAGRY